MDFCNVGGRIIKMQMDTAVTPDFEALKDAIDGAMYQSDVDALVEIRRTVLLVKPGGRRNYLIAALIRAFYVCGAVQHARNTLEIYVGRGMEESVPAEIRMLPLIFDGELSLSTEQLLEEARLFARSDNFDIRVPREIMSRLRKLLHDPTLPAGQFTEYDHVATVVSQKPLSTKAINCAVKIETGPNVKFSKPKTLNTVCYSLDEVCGRTISRPTLTLYELENVELYKCGSGIAILCGGQYISGLFNGIGLFTTCYGDWSETPAIEAAYPAILAFDRHARPNMCHWHFDALPRVAALLDAYGHATANSTVLVETATPYIVGSLKAFGIPRERITELGKKARIRFRRLYVSSTSFRDLRHPAQSGSPDLLQTLRDRLRLEEVSASIKSRIFVSRRDATKRQLVNETEFVSALSPLGVQFIAPGELSYQDQIATFSTASIIIGIHGAGLTNLLFARPQATIIEIFPPRYGTMAYFVTSVGLGHNYICMNGDGPNNLPPPAAQRNAFARQAFTASVDILETFLRTEFAA